MVFFERLEGKGEINDLLYGSLAQVKILRKPGRMPAECFQMISGEGLIAIEQLPRVRSLKTEQKLEKRGFTASRFSTENHVFALLNIKTEAAEQRFARVREADVITFEEHAGHIGSG